MKKKNPETAELFRKQNTTESKNPNPDQEHTYTKLMTVAYVLQINE